jgi:hypothetical protein
MTNTCGSCGKNTTRQAGPSGYAICAKCLPSSKIKTKKNPQLQILENPGMLANLVSILTGPKKSDLSDISLAKLETIKPRSTDFDVQEFQKALSKYKEFHDVSEHRFETEMWIDDGSEDVVHVVFAGLGKVPFISWVDNHGKRITFDVEDEVLDFTGKRVSFGEANMPWLVCDNKTNEALVLGGAVEKLKQYAGPDGVIGYAPAIEYVVDWKSNKKDSHYVHRFNQDKPPKLVWDSKLGGIRYVGGIYCIRGWFYN